MDVAIIGAGLAGLSCAYELEKHGIYPVIYECNSYIGEQFSHVGGILNVLFRSLGEPLAYMKDTLGIEIRPINTINRVIHHSPNKATEITGNLGYLFERSSYSQDMKNQIYSKLKKSKVILNTFADYKHLAKENDYVVIANGNNIFSNELGCWIERQNTHVRGAVVLGDFDPQGLIVWLNKSYCKNGYAYLTPFDSKRASIVLVTTDVNEKEIDHFWELFLYTENIKYTIVEEFKLNHRSGNVYPHRVDNIFLTGNAAGAIDPFLGFGVLSSITTGIMSARSIVKNRDYEKLIRDITTLNIKLYEFRKVFNKTNNSTFDKIVSSIGLPGIKQLIYYSPIDIISLGSFLFKHL